MRSVIFAPPIDIANGEDVTVIANPGLGTEILDNTITTGVVSNGKRTLEGNEYIQSSAAVNPGSSGGPMFDHNGQVVGTVVLKGRIEGVGFAVPVKTITRFLFKATTREGNDGQLFRNWLDDSETRGLAASLVDQKENSVTVLKVGEEKPISFKLDALSAGDRKLLELLKSTK